VLRREVAGMGQDGADTATRSSFLCPILKFTQRVFLKPQITQIPQIQHSENDPLYLSYL
jgi:hypothetical protein